MSIVPPEDEYWLNIAQPDPPRAGSPFARIAAEHKRLIHEARITALREAKDCIVPDGNPALAAARIQKLIDEAGNGPH